MMSAAAPMDGNRFHLHVKVAGLSRSAILYVPKSVGDGRVPLVVVLHGRFGTGAIVEGELGFDSLANKYGFLVAYPNGRHRGWNDGRTDAASKRLQGQDAHVDDVVFLDGLIARIRAQFPIDPLRIFLAGHSNGAFMANRYAAERTEEVAAVASVAGTLGLAILPLLHPSEPVSSLDVYGTLDRIIPPQGGEVFEHGGQVLGAEALGDWWARQDGCQTTVHRDLRDWGVFRIRHDGCPPGIDVETLEVLGQGHVWPGAPHESMWLELAAGPEVHTLDATSAVWAFFASHPKPLFAARQRP
jgi:polyhydroxybutyrate depolymerase